MKRTFDEKNELDFIQFFIDNVTNKILKYFRLDIGFLGL
jgi:hypothetical protein